jgi:archaellum biogenesis ATPase FlaH
MEANLQKLVLQSFVHDEDFCRKAMPHVKAEYFESGERVAYELILDFILKYNKLPTASALAIELQTTTKGAVDTRNHAGEVIKDLEVREKIDIDWLLHQTEKWCQERSVFLAVMESLAIIDGKRPNVAPGMIPNILQKALSVTFDTNVGHDYIEGATQRYEYYHKKEARIPFDIEMLNSITRGGVPKKTLNIVMAGVNVGKSLVLCHLAASYLVQGKNVLYITLEMSEERIAERIDANLFDVSLDQIEKLPKDVFDTKVKKIAAKTHGKLIIKEYPTAAAHSGHFRALLNELKLKRNFIPEVIFIDYIGICASARVKGLSGSVNTNSFVKAVSEELRGLAIEFNVPLWTATQVNRTGFASSDPEMTDIADSFSLTGTADFMISLTETEQLEKLGQFLIKQLKNRYNNKATNKRFIVGVDKDKMRLYDVNASGQNIMGGNTSGSTNSESAGSKPWDKGRKIVSVANIKV